MWATIVNKMAICLNYLVASSFHIKFTLPLNRINNQENNQGFFFPWQLFINLFVSQVTWCGQVFTEPGTVLCTLITQTLSHLDPSLSSCITEFIKNESNIIEKLINLRQVRLHLYNWTNTVRFCSISHLAFRAEFSDGCREWLTWGGFDQCVKDNGSATRLPTKKWQL